jgi:hypothetical protein
MKCRYNFAKLGNAGQSHEHDYSASSTAAGNRVGKGSEQLSTKKMRNREHYRGHAYYDYHVFNSLRDRLTFEKASIHSESSVIPFQNANMRDMIHQHANSKFNHSLNLGRFLGPYPGIFWRRPLAGCGRSD